MTSTEALGSGIQAIAAESGKAIGSASKSSGSSEDGGLNELYKVNQVWYRLPPTLSLVAKRTLLVNNALQLNYPQPFGQTMTFIFNSGEYYVSMPSSYLFIEMGYNSTVRDMVPGNFDGTASAGAYNWAKALISQGNAMSMFDEISFTSASGTEICREQNKGLESAFRFRYENCQEYIDTIGQVQGAMKGSYSGNYDGVGPIPDDMTVGTNTGESNLMPIGGNEMLVQPRSGPSHTYMGLDQGSQNVNNISYKVTPKYTQVCIPMDQVCGCFKPYMQTLFPAGALAGGRLELRLKDPTEIFQYIASMIPNTTWDNGTPTTDPVNPYLKELISNKDKTFTINKIYIVMDAFQLQDNVLKRLNNVSAGQDGLSVLFDTYDHSVAMPGGSGSFEAQVQQARSRIVRSYCVVRDSANIQNPFINSLCSEPIVTRVCESCPPGYLNTTPLTPVAATNSTGVLGSMIVKTGSTPTYNWMQRTRLPGNVATTAAEAKDAIPIFSVENPIVGSYQAQLGSLFFPQQPLTTPAEYYENALYIWNKSIPDRSETCSVSFEDFKGGMGWGLYDPTTRDSKGNLSPSLTYPPPTVDPNKSSVVGSGNLDAMNGKAVNPTTNSVFGRWIAPYGCGIYGMLAEKSQALQLSGLPISNARLLRHKFYFNYPPLSQSTRTISTFTQFTRVMKVFLGGRVVIRE